ncbi:Glycosyltransferase family 10 (fucosyltransferase) C-term [Algoriphagus locisalis]|uniref:Glycosyltransferase family 10 (Fucosyltransferase) C-term n=1 Tax=Algoriphagus locisalis TaxID=305507 RepID=A0A1I6XTG3_9BACT|nr:glycosyltransferase family 10 [Algoriphagus locisalis]SFT41610.1 Glycosyltransferase family 10 (fucosyltransferase) C-term [Algoriphagus locisalis]
MKSLSNSMEEVENLSKIKIKFVDFWPNFFPEEDWLFQFINRNFDVVLCEEEPNFLFFSSFGRKHLEYDCYKVFYCAENVRPNYLECDFSICFDFNKFTNHYRLPFYGTLLKWEPELLINRDKVELDEIRDKKFCCFLTSNEDSAERILFFKKLSEYKHIDSGGLVLNNLGFRVEDKMNFIKQYKFIIAFENSSYPGYVTEKIWQPFFVDMIPIYWGSSSINLDFNTNRFINCHDYSNFDDVISKIIELDQDDEKYLAMVNEPVFYQNSINKFIDRGNILLFLNDLFSSNKTPVSKTWRKSFSLLKRRYNNLLIKVSKLLN